MDFYKQDFLSAAERTKDRLDAIADSGGVVGTLMDGHQTSWTIGRSPSG